VQGRIQSRSWEQDGQKRNKVEVLASDVTFLDSRGEGGNEDGGSSSAGGGYSGGNNAAPASAKPASKPKKDDIVIEDIGDEPINLDDIPF
jgi:single-strand DNA-binding protein